jgi:hypothetical protein
MLGLDSRDGGRVPWVYPNACFRVVLVIASYAPVFVASFLASTVEFVEAFTIVLVIGVTINWRSSLAGAALAVLALAAFYLCVSGALYLALRASGAGSAPATPTARK